MTPLELKGLDFIRERLAAGLSPSYSEIATAIGCQKSGVHRIVTSLVRQGKLERLPRKARSLSLGGATDLRGVPTGELRAELARRGVTLDALNGGERVWLGRPRSYGAGSGTCAADGCQLEVQRGHLMCLEHWRALPFEVRERILSTHRAARRSRHPSDAALYGEAVTEARELLNQQRAFG